MGFRGKRLIDGLNQLAVARCHLRGITTDHLSVPIDEELLEVPLHIPRLGRMRHKVLIHMIFIVILTLFDWVVPRASATTLR